MADDPKSLAERLGEFVTAAGRVARPPPVETTRGGVQIQVAGMMNPGPSFRPNGEVYEACLGKLSVAERSEFARMLELMFAALGDGTL